MPFEKVGSITQRLNCDIEGIVDCVGCFSGKLGYGRRFYNFQQLGFLGVLLRGIDGGVG